MVMELTLPFLECTDRQIMMTCIAMHALAVSRPGLTCSLRKTRVENMVGICAECKEHRLRYGRVKQIAVLMRNFAYNSMKLPRATEKDADEDVCRWNTAWLIMKSKKLPSTRQIIDMAKTLDTILGAGRNREVTRNRAAEANRSFQLLMLLSSFLTSTVGATFVYNARNKYEIKRCLKRAVAIHAYLLEA